MFPGERCIRRRIKRTVSTFHIRMVVSSEADARHTPSVDHAMSESPFVWPFRLRIRSPVNGDHILIRLSAAVDRSSQGGGYA